jgi:hypothetical protein
MNRNLASTGMWAQKRCLTIIVKSFTGIIINKKIPGQKIIEENFFVELIFRK